MRLNLQENGLSDREMTAVAGWSTYSNYVMYAGADELDLKEISSFLQEIRNTIHEAPNRVRYDMNQFIICVGAYVPELRDEAKNVAEAVGKVHVDVGNTACKVPIATDYIEKVLHAVNRRKRKRFAVNENRVISTNKHILIQTKSP